MIYLADKDPNSKFLPKDTRKRAEVISWLMFQMVTPLFNCIAITCTPYELLLGPSCPPGHPIH